MKEFQLCGLGNALVDIFLEISEAEFASLGFERGTMRLVDLAEQKTLLDRFQKHEPKLVSGGSVANSIIAFSQLGGQAAFIGCVGDDRYGLFYAGEFEELGIDIDNPIIVNESTGTCVSIVTPDAERTMRTCLAVASHLSAHRSNCSSGGDPHRQTTWHQNRHHLFRSVCSPGLRRRVPRRTATHGLALLQRSRSLRRSPGRHSRGSV